METSPFVKQLGSNNRVVRENALENVKKYLKNRRLGKTKQIEFDKLWKGLYFAMWFSDRPRPQQRLADELGSLYGLYMEGADGSEEKMTENDKSFIKFCKSYWRVMCLEWYNIDHHRLDKYLLLMRRVLFNQLKYLKMREWNEELVQAYIDKVLKKLPLSGDRKVYTGIPMHIVDILLDEWVRLLTEEDDEDDDDEEEPDEDEAALIESIKETPLDKIIAIFQDICSDEDVSKVLKTRIKEELLEDVRLVKWGIIEPLEEDPAEEQESDNDGTEWAGFD
ncbi:hypothetical protein TBLA_0J00500 [Henningerozyma blattae CBS 6284]|uniref:Ribosomal RNA-processing protein 1 n=1 Tax=Henningerozyma blattae (strain ATCC 34711 / CBS 6284 / DSM 70876 / NBRC 10599 / NRRL Y-10934 / UCD 77-7) TaxID=1071380 RepID=I2H9J8_HENB6|nr:hypothetical protein TBLA_0J00500 [Tetrapisispora blattae CBS 6284]CCH63050.1 hypothetical protein TBLA_0J00500 [Tetrapisispora blattae CBS 6284]